MHYDALKKKEKPANGPSFMSERPRKVSQSHYKQNKISGKTHQDKKKPQRVSTTRVLLLFHLAMGITRMSNTWVSSNSQISVAAQKGIKQNFLPNIFGAIKT